jgi:hypothetical protein
MNFLPENHRAPDDPRVAPGHTEDDGSFMA